MTKPDTTKYSFQPKKVIVTYLALSTLTSPEMLAAIERHARGDWGDISPDDANLNLTAFRRKDRTIFSAYGQGDRRFLIITDGDLSETTVLLPADY
ncbi:MAG: type I restriction endonuclease subunit M [Planctomyces sp.]|jgi:hypothetical protein